ncbi:MAG: PPC domain-containing protein [Candidatus Ranarchaeia archaeon]
MHRYICNRKVLFSAIVFLGIIYLSSGLIVANGQSYTGTWINDLPFYDTAYLDEANNNQISFASDTFDDYKIYQIALQEGDGIEVRLDVPSDADFDLYVGYVAGTDIIVEESSTAGTGDSENIQFQTDTARTYVIIVCVFYGSGWYDLEVDEYQPISSPDFPIVIVFLVLAFFIFSFIVSRCCCRRKPKPPVYPPSEYETPYPPTSQPYGEYPVPPPPPIQPPIDYPEKGILEPTWQPEPSPKTTDQQKQIPSTTALRECEACGNKLPPGETLCPLCGYKNPD